MALNLGLFVTFILWEMALTHESFEARFVAFLPGAADLEPLIDDSMEAQNRSQPIHQLCLILSALGDVCSDPLVSISLSVPWD